jgi:hypothetical protein
MEYLINALCELDGEDVIALAAIALFTVVLLFYSAVVAGAL